MFTSEFIIFHCFYKSNEMLNSKNDKKQNNKTQNNKTQNNKK